MPVGNFAHRTWSLDTIPASVRDRLERGRFSSNPNDTLEEKLRLYIEHEEDMVRHVLRTTKEYFINCWHSSNHESVAMWKMYAEDSFGIAIVSDVDRITRALAGSPLSIQCGMVDYIDYDTETLDLGNAFTPTITKRLSFSHEREVRLLYWDHTLGEEQVAMLWGGEPRVMWMPKSHDDHAKIDPPAGKTFQCDLDILIKEVRIAPTAEPWFEAAVRAFCKAAQFDKPIIKSDMTRSPMR
ncbi:hypothetical protein ASG68_08500 [Rhizobium sp. Leaf453]|nr:hypothetical protein ASG68_08500 [Rhizobium sp. Leaf453]